MAEELRAGICNAIHRRGEASERLVGLVLGLCCSGDAGWRRGSGSSTALGVLLPLPRILKLNQRVFRETRDKTEAEMHWNHRKSSKDHRNVSGKGDC
jgi:hypothetical protein